MSIISKDKNIPLICRGHSRLVSYLEHSQVFKGDACYLLSACVGKYINLHFLFPWYSSFFSFQDGEAHLRNAKTGDWIGTFSGHKGALWSAKFNQNANLVITASADYTAYCFFFSLHVDDLDIEY